MKTNALFLMVAGAFSISTFAQDNNNFQDKSKIVNSNNDLAVVSYHVEERINMNFGGSITTYNVPSLNMVSTKELGENNIRIVTPKYAKVRAKSVAVTILKDEAPKALSNTASPITSTNAVAVVIPDRKKESVIIDVVDTYERVMDKGYKSVTMITKVADRHFFDGDLVLAAKWYAELFNAATTELEAVYYYRYAESLKAINQIQKASEMMKIFESKSL
jgi:hypothetical protein